MGRGPGSSDRPLSRRDFLRLAVGAAAAGPASLLASPARVGPSPYGDLLAPDSNGVRLPAGFTSRVIARSGQRVAGHVWHAAPDGGATFATDDGGWVYVSNSEIGGRGGGVGAVRFDADGEIVDAYPILDGTSRNCAGGPTPWGTWLSCEEVEGGRVWECDPFGGREAQVRPALGVFTHEAAAVDPERGHVYLTEDHRDGRFYRFVPDAYPSLDDGRLEAARVIDLTAVVRGGSSAVEWLPVRDPAATTRPTRAQARGSTPFEGGEGCWYERSTVVFTTKHDERVWSFDTARGEISLLFDERLSGAGVLSGVDNVTIASGDVVVAEDGGDLDLVVITSAGTVARMLKVTGDAHRGSELAGPAFDPSGTRLYFSSQRGFRDGVTFEVTGPFRAPSTTPAPTPESTPVGIGIVAAAAAAVAGLVALRTFRRPTRPA